MSFNQINSKAIGGYFELELPAKRDILYPDALCYQSARAAFFALLMEGQPGRVWMPKYICDSMLAPLKKAGIEYQLYGIDVRFDIAESISLADDDWLLFVNYFGISSRNVDKVLERFNRDQVVIDHAQAFFSPPRDCLATIYSPRKFFGIPDGGMLVSKIPVEKPDCTDDGSLARTGHLLKRIAVHPEAGYDDYKCAEESLSDIAPRQMSLLTQRLFASIDYEHARVRRNMNFSFLHKHLGHLNRMDIDAESVNGPLCYPFFSSIKDVREKLRANRIYAPTYWPDVISRVPPGADESVIANGCIPLPCDQRYSIEDLSRVVTLLENCQK